MNKNILCIVVCVLAILLMTVLDSRGQIGITGNAAFVGAAGFSAASGGGGGGADMTVNLWQTFEFNTPADAAAWATALGGNDAPSSLSWAANNTYSRFSIATFGEYDNPSTINTTSDAGHTRGLAWDLSGGEKSSLSYTLTAGSSAVSIGWWIKVPALPGNAAPVQIFSVYGSGGRPFDLRLDSDASGHPRFTAFGATTSSAITTADTTATWYWLSLNWTQNSTVTVDVYDTTGTRISGSPVTCTARNEPATYILLGADDTFTSPGSLTVYFDDFIMDTTAHLNPIKPW